MGLFQRLFGRRDAMEAKAVDFSPELLSAILTGSWGGPAKSGASVSTGTALQVAAWWRGINVIADGIRQLPVEIYRELPSGRGAEPARDHPLYDVLRWQPNQHQSAADFWGTVLLHAAGAGRSVSYKNTVGGQVRELIPVRPDWTTVEVLTDMSLRYRVTFENSRGATLEQSEVFHIRGPSWDGVDGLNPVDLGREALGLAMATEESHARFHANGARPSGALVADKSAKAIDPAEIERLRVMFAEKYAGTANAGKPMILQGGLDWKQMQMTGVDAQHLETRKHQVAEIARVLRLWPIMLGLGGDESPTFASALEFMRAHVRFSLQPWLISIIGAIQTQLLTAEERREGYHVRIDTSELVRGSVQERAEYYKAALGTASSPGWLTQNEVREDDGWNPLDNPEANEVPPPPVNNPQSGGVTTGPDDPAAPPSEGKSARRRGNDGPDGADSPRKPGGPANFDPSQPRDASGRWRDDGGDEPKFTAERVEIRDEADRAPSTEGGKYVYLTIMQSEDPNGRAAWSPDDYFEQISQDIGGDVELQTNASIMSAFTSAEWDREEAGIRAAARAWCDTELPKRLAKDRANPFGFDNSRLGNDEYSLAKAYIMFRRPDDSPFWAAKKRARRGAPGVKAADGHTPTDAMVAEARRGLAWRDEHGRGGTAIGVARARDIATRRTLSRDTVMRMVSYFARHEVDKQGEGWSPGQPGYPSAGRIAWALWGGDAGRSWANAIADRLDADEE